MKSLGWFSARWSELSSDNDFPLMELKSYKLETSDLTQNFPKGSEQCKWYGIYFVSQPAATGLSPSVTLLNSDFDSVLDRKQGPQHGHMLLLHRNLLPRKVSQELKKIDLFSNRNAGPFTLDFDQTRQLNSLLNKISDEIASTYRYKNELIAIFLMQLVHFIIKNFTGGAVPVL